MRIHSGTLKGRRVISPPDESTTRPIPDRVKSSVFQILRGHFEGEAVFDGFAGTGAIGLEAASLGASRVVMVERDKRVAMVCEKNVETLGIGDRCEVVRGDALGPIALALLNVAGLPWPIVVALTLAAGAGVGLVNGLLVCFLRLLAFLPTLVTLIIVRAVVDMLLLKYSVKIAGSFPDSDSWYYLGEGLVFGIPFSAFVVGIIAIVAHLVLSRSRIGWHVLAIGGSRRSAHNVGIPVRRVVCATYVISGTLAALAGVLFASRLGGAGADTGIGLEIAALTGAVLGGNSLGGGRGSAAKAIIGSVTVMIMVNSLLRLGVTSGANALLLGIILLAAVAIDVRWLKNRHTVLSKVYVSPAFASLPAAPGTGPQSPYAVNDKLGPVELIGLGEIDGPEDVILDEDDHIYTGNRTGAVYPAQIA